MIFSHDTEVALQAAAALVNTQERAGDRLADLAGLNRFVEEWAWTGSKRGDLAELDEVRALRPRLRRLWQLDENGVVAEVNAFERRITPLGLSLQTIRAARYALCAMMDDAASYIWALESRGEVSASNTIGESAGFTFR